MVRAAGGAEDAPAFITVSKRPAMRLTRTLVFTTLLATGLAPVAQAQTSLSDISVLSTLPIAVSVAAPVALLSAGAALTVVSVEATSTGAVWVLERASDGAQASVRLAGAAVAGVSLAAGTVVVVTAISTGWILSAAGRAIAFCPNRIGSALIYDERITR
jgi:hypothetical protein